MRKSWKDQWKPGTKEREAFEDIDAIVALIKTDLDAYKSNLDALGARLDAIQSSLNALDARVVVLEP